jgi:hypothetical protein
MKNFKSYNKDLRAFLVDQTRRLLKAKRGSIVGEEAAEEEPEEVEEGLELEELKRKLEARERRWTKVKFLLKYFAAILLVAAAVAWLIRYNQPDVRYSRLGRLGEKWKKRGWLQPEPTVFFTSKKILDDLEKLRYLQESTSLSRFLHTQLTTHCIINKDNSASSIANRKKLCNEMHADWRKLTVVKNKE